MAKTISFVEKYTPWLLETVDSSTSLAPEEIHEIQKKARDKNPKVRRDVASSESAPGDILHDLAIDKDVTVRRAVAGNRATPAKANMILAKDEDEDVRLILAGRLVNLLPDLSEEEQAEVYASTVQVLRVLADDKIKKVRIALAASLKDVANAPPDVIRQLAEDVEKEVAEPILRFSMSLSDEDLLAIIAMNPTSWRVSSIANRTRVSKKVSSAVVDSNNEEAGLALLNNKGSKLSKQTLKEVIRKSQDFPAWQAASKNKKKLPGRVAHMLNDLVGDALSDFLSIRSPVDKKTQKEVLETVNRRVQWAENKGSDESSAMRVKRLVAEGRLSESDIADALVWDDEEFVVSAIAYMAKVSPMVVRRMFETQSAKATVAICKRAGLSAKLAVDIQQQLVKVPPGKILHAKGGTGYPLSDEDVKWQLEFFGIE